MYDTLIEAVLRLQLVEVFGQTGADYEWAEFRAWKAPSGRFYWFEDSGCSCYGYGDGFDSEADFSDGDRDGLERAFRAWARNNPDDCTAQEVIDGVEQLRRL